MARNQIVAALAFAIVGAVAGAACGVAYDFYVQSDTFYLSPSLHLYRVIIGAGIGAALFVGLALYSRKRRKGSASR